jgi:hypothetical protein
MSVAVYRNKSAFLEYVVGGSVIGMLFKFSLGPKGMLAGAFFGAFAGLIIGAMNTLMSFLTGASLTERRYWMHKWRDDSNT